MNNTILYNPHACGGHGAENAQKLRKLLAEGEMEFVDIPKLPITKVFFGICPEKTG